MPRERWFYTRDMRRMGPVPKRQLLESLLALPDPRGCLIWRHGLPAWTPAREVPEIDRQLIPFVKAESLPGRDHTIAAPSTASDERVAAGGVAPTADRGGQAAPRARQPNVGLYFAGLAGLLLVVIVGWFFWPSSEPGERQGGRDGPQTGSRAGLAPSSRTGASPSDGSAAGPAGKGQTPSAEEGPGPGVAAFAGWSDQETQVPPDQLRRLRGVGAWRGNTLKITLYNGTTWRITEILVRTSQLRGDEFVDGEIPHRLLPAGGAPVDAGMADLLNKVAPDRKKAGVNPLDTGDFEATVGPRPEGYRWRIEGARGYPPLG